MLNGDYKTGNRWTEAAEASTSGYEEKRNKNIPLNSSI
jgi:hypothetical protein